MPIYPIILKKYYNDIFIETGTNNGTGVENALAADCKTIHSIEIVESLYEYCKNKFQANSGVHLYCGDCLEVLPKILENINEPVTFWLDGHYSGEGTGKGEYPNPVLQELEIIKNHKIKTHNILIDDMRCWKKNNKHIFIDEDGFDENDIKNKILEINPNYKFKYEYGHIQDDVLAAYVEGN